ncbi:MAG: hypothetical protein LBD24_02715, partial [Spirochaetaceae bacterium]|nr:hypothetical protein [Spirochaetaceae bacterium]
ATASSPDGITWTESPSTTLTGSYNSIVYDAFKDALVAVGDSGAIAYSNNGVTWTAGPTPLGTTINIKAVATDGSGNLVAVGAADADGNVSLAYTQ